MPDPAWSQARLQELAEAMVAGGAVMALAAAADGETILSVREGVPRLKLVALFRQLADAMERDEVALVRRSEVP